MEGGKFLTSVMVIKQPLADPAFRRRDLVDGIGVLELLRVIALLEVDPGTRCSFPTNTASSDLIEQIDINE